MKVYESQYVIINKHDVRVATRTFYGSSWADNDESIKKVVEQMGDCRYRNTYNNIREIKEENGSENF